MEGLSVGRIVHFKSPRFANGECRAAMIVRVWGESGTCNLTVFPDWTNDHLDEGHGLVWKTSVQHEGQLAGQEHASDTWHWPERA